MKRIAVSAVLAVMLLVGGFMPIGSVMHITPLTVTPAYALGGCEDEKNLTEELLCLWEYFIMELGFGDNDGDGTWS